MYRSRETTYVNKRKIERFTSTSANRGGKTMKKEKVAERDPAWSRSRPNAKTKKKTKMCSRASLRLLSTLIRKKRTMDKNREHTVCVTRTVEFPSIQNNVGDKKSKLLFMIALGLLPNPDVKKEPNGPFVCLEKLDPKVESEARASTREKIFQIFQERKLELLHRRIASVPVHSKVEVVDLVSSDDESASDGVESDVESRTPDETYRNPLNSQKISHYRTVSSSSPLYRILTPSQPRKPVFKPIANNQESGVFRNWKPESMKKLMNSNQSDSRTFAVSSSKLLSSLKNVPKNTTMTKSFTTKIPTGTATCKTHLHVVKETEKVVPNIMIPTAIITID